MIRRAVYGAALVALAVLPGCDTTTTPSDIELNDLVRSFNAEMFTVTERGTITNLLSQGASLTITLNSDHTTSGRLVVPGAGEGGGSLDVSLAGTFSFDDAQDAVVFTHSADTFLRDMTFTAGRLTGHLTLAAEASFSGADVVLVLR